MLSFALHVVRNLGFNLEHVIADSSYELTNYYMVVSWRPVDPRLAKGNLPILASVFGVGVLPNVVWNLGVPCVCN